MPHLRKRRRAVRRGWHGTRCDTREAHGDAAILGSQVAANPLRNRRAPPPRMAQAVPSSISGKNFNLCGTPQNMTYQHIISDLQFLREVIAGRAANDARHPQTWQEFQLVAP